MSPINPYTLRLQITRMFEQNQTFFVEMKVHDWLRERNEDPAEYDLTLHCLKASGFFPHRLLSSQSEIDPDRTSPKAF
ncbi:hypothetical protein K4A83_10595 [Spirulina subsalsa FACHB-351]|uniref:Uncharacterized protein n=1 Tax=Spirulina subsalsa FACHB-351 TaxID=234711 RepID=A0ABT3L5B2_9CYAN|nr:hypothetical protein [Spirulina subsalsa]MCW6036706.1 hypothetical protein [Spirulina subsalsa FACHB-351]